MSRKNEFSVQANNLSYYKFLKISYLFILISIFDYYFADL